MKVPLMKMNPDRFLVVVPRKTSMTPDHAHVGYPDLFSPRGISISISVVFTWDKDRAANIARAWRDYGCNVTLGGPAFDDPGGEFLPGLYIKNGVTITSRGCPRSCPWCYVPRREGLLRELKKIHPGYIIQDNNILACSKSHLNKVFQMLRQVGHYALIQFKGGIDPRLLKDWHIQEFKNLRISEIWLSADHKDYEKASLQAIRKLINAGFHGNKVRCYVMIGYNETREQAEQRLFNIYLAGALPFAQFYDRYNGNDKPEWKLLARTWSRPAAIKARTRELGFNRGMSG